jgi:hypothetical protein
VHKHADQKCLCVQKLRQSLAAPVDTLACVAFTFATVVTVQFHIIDYITGGLVLPSAVRPWWLGTTVHVFNSWPPGGVLIDSDLAGLCVTRVLGGCLHIRINITDCSSAPAVACAGLS